jgi:hypothetical protein
MHKRASVLASAFAIALVGLGTAVVPATSAGAVTKVYVSQLPPNPKVARGCANAQYSSVQSAVSAATSGTVIAVCAGTYHEQVVVSTSYLTIQDIGSVVVQPTTATTNATDTDTGQPIVALFDVTPGTQAIKVSGITFDGSQIQSSVDGCSTDLVGILYQASTAGNTSGSILSNTVENVTPSNVGCGSGLGIFVQSGPSGTATASLKIQKNHVSGYGKNGITCSDLGTNCTISSNVVSTTSTAQLAQNGIQIGFGAVGSVKANSVSGNDWTAYAGDTNPQPQSDYGAGILLYGAGINASGITTVSIPVASNTLTDNQIGVEVVDSASTVGGNNITETGSGIPDSIGIYGVACDAYCGYFNDVNGASLASTAALLQRVSLVSDKIDFGATPSGSDGIWLGDNSWSGGGGYAAPSGSESYKLIYLSIANVATPELIGGGAVK